MFTKLCVKISLFYTNSYMIILKYSQLFPPVCSGKIVLNRDTDALQSEKNTKAAEPSLVAKAEKFAKEKVSEEYSNFNRVISITLKSKGKEKVLEAVRKLEKRDDVKAACPRMYGKACAVPNDPKYKAYWPDRIKLPKAWDVTTGSKNVKVGIIDTGIKGDHPDLVGNIDVAASESFVGGTDNPLIDTDGHGTLELQV